MFVETKREGEATPDLGTLRVDRILMLADEIEKPTKGYGFNMGCWNEQTDAGRSWVADVADQNFCGTVCCIGGTAELLFKEDAQKALGITEAQDYALFLPEGLD